MNVGQTIPTVTLAVGPSKAAISIPLPVAVAVLGVGLVGLFLGGWRTRRPLVSPTPDLTGWFARWQVQHRAPDLDPADTTVLRIFLTLTYRLASPLARRGILPATVTLAGLWLALTVPVLATCSPAAAAGLCLLSSVLDGVDGAVAGLSDRASARGFVLDSVVDRLAELAFFFALVAAGGHFVAAAAGWAAVVMIEYTRARAGNAGLEQVGIVTIAERPTRVLCVVFALLGAAIVPGRATLMADAGAGVAIVTALIGLGQLTWALRTLLPE